MKVHTSRQDFLDTLARVDPGLSKRSFIEQSSSYVFHRGFITTYNDEICVQTPSPFPEDFTAAIAAKPLKDLLGSMVDETIEFSATKSELVIHAGHTEAALKVVRQVNTAISEVSLPEDDEWLTVPDGFGDAIRIVSEVAGTTQQEFIAQCIHLHPNRIEASDRRQFIRYQMNTGLKEPFLVRAKSIMHVAGLGVSFMGYTREWAHFGNAFVTFSCRRHLDDYYEKEHMDKVFSFKGKRAVLPDGAELAAKIAGVFCDNKEHLHLVVQLRKGQMTIQGRGPAGRATIPLTMDYQGPDLDFRTLPGTLSGLIKKYNQCEIGPPGGLIVHGDSWDYFTALEKPNENPPSEPDVTPDHEVALDQDGSDSDE